MDTVRIRIVRVLDRLAAGMRRLRLDGITRALRPLAQKLVGQRLRVEAAGFRLEGSFDHRGYLYAARDGLLDDYTRSLFQACLRPGATVVDVGAHLGLFSLIAGQAVGRSGHVVAFEPEDDTYSHLVRNIHTNDLDEVVTAKRVALSDRSGTRTFARHGPDPSQSGFAPRDESDQLVDVAVGRGDTELQHLVHVDVLKIDVEGAEPEVLRGLAKTIARSDHMSVICELNPRALDRCGHSASELVATLSNLDFTVSMVDETQRKLVPLPHRLESMVPYANLYCTKNGGIPSPES